MGFPAIVAQSRPAPAQTDEVTKRLQQVSSTNNTPSDIAGQVSGRGADPDDTNLLKRYVGLKPVTLATTCLEKHFSGARR